MRRTQPKAQSLRNHHSPYKSLEITMKITWKRPIQLACLFLGMFCASQLNAASKSNKFFKPYQKFSPTASVVVMPINHNYLLSVEEIVILKKELKEQLAPIANKVLHVKFDTKDDIDLYHQTTVYRENFSPSAGDQRGHYAQNVLSNFDIVVYPSVVPKVGKMNGRFIKMDGVKLAIEGDSNTSGSAHYGWEGQQIVYSLELMVYDTQGNWLATTYGGLTMPKYARFDTKTFHRKANVFSTEKRLNYMEKGIRNAVKPLIKKLRKKK